MKKVCHLTSAHNSYDTRIFHKQCASLAKTGYTVYLVAPGQSRNDKDVQIIGVGEKPISRLKRMTETAKKVYQAGVVLDADIYHLHDPELLPYALRLKKRGKKVIFDSHEDVLEYISEKNWIPSLLRSPLHLLLTQYIRYLLPKLDALISVTPHLHDKLITLNPNTKMVTNYPLIPGEATTVKSSEQNQPFSLVFAGGVTQQWSHIEIIQAIQQMNQVCYQIYGKGSEAYLQQLKDLDVAGQMVYKGVIPHNEVAIALSKSSIGMALCKYSKNTGGAMGSLGNTKLFEYMMAGLPVVCTDFILWERIIKENKCGICVNPDDCQEIRDAIQYLKNNPEIAKMMGANGREAVIREYNWDIEEKKLINLYSDLSKPLPN